jgi:predicted RNA-binding protein YlxR (DUF448 family)
MSKVRKIPLRKCVITQERLPKQDLIRVVKDKEGTVTFDKTGKLNGRGAYLKKNPKVIKQAKKTQKLNRHLETTVPDSVYDAILEYINDER